jgi:hypothetical protein
MRGLGLNARGGYAMAGSRQGNMVMGLMGGSNHGLKNESQYEMFDADDESQSGSHSGSVSSVTTGYDDTPTDGFENGGRGSELAFGDRIY